MATRKRDREPKAMVVEGGAGGASKAVTRARATPTTVAERVDRIADVMRRGEWVRGKSAGPLAEEWGLAVNTVEQLASEAWRRVCAEADDAAAARPTIAGTLAVALAQSAADRQHKATAQLADTWSRVVGARAPEKHMHAVVVAQYDSLPKAGKVQWLRERAAELAAEAERLEQEDAS